MQECTELQRAACGADRELENLNPYSDGNKLFFGRLIYHYSSRKTEMTTEINTADPEGSVSARHIYMVSIYPDKFILLSLHRRALSEWNGRLCCTE